MHTFKRNMGLFAVTLSCLLGAGCATEPLATPALSVAELFDDAGVPPPSRPINAGTLFALSPKMRAYLDSEQFKVEVHRKGPEIGLVDALYNQEGLKLEYDSAITRDAADTYAARRGNCLSLVIMTAAFAKALQLEVSYQDVRMGTDWVRNGDLYVGSNHVNLSLAAPPGVNFGAFATSTRITVDFVPPPQAAQHRIRKLTENMIVAMFFNNRAAEEIEAKRLDQAYWYAKAAVQQEPSLVTAWNTLGVVYHKRGNNRMAERVFQRALAREPEDIMLMNNLVPVLAQQGKTAEASAMSARAASVNPEPPFHFYEAGMKAMEAGNFSVAKAMFAREVQRSPFNHEFHYWLGSAHMRLGEVRSARNELGLALENSNSHEASKRYSSKLERLRAMN